MSECLVTAISIAIAFVISLVSLIVCESFRDSEKRIAEMRIKELKRQRRSA